MCCHPVAAGGTARARSEKTLLCVAWLKLLPQLPRGPASRAPASLRLRPCVCARPLLRPRVPGWRRGALLSVRAGRGGLRPRPRQPSSFTRCGALRPADRRGPAGCHAAGCVGLGASQVPRPRVSWEKTRPAAGISKPSLSVPCRGEGRVCPQSYARASLSAPCKLGVPARPQGTEGTRVQSDAQGTGVTYAMTRGPHVGTWARVQQARSHYRAKRENVIPSHEPASPNACN